MRVRWQRARGAFLEWDRRRVLYEAQTVILHFVEEGSVFGKGAVMV